MPKIAYETIKFREESLLRIAQANEIIERYQAMGYDLTLRQLYYQFVSRDLIPNRDTEYKRLGDIVSKGRRAGLIDWNAIVDRTRNLRIGNSWASPQSIVDACASQYRIDKRADQDFHVEVWIEKDALVGIFEGPCDEAQVGLFACRGYTSDSEVWAAAQRLRKACHRSSRNGFKGRTAVILHFGDHDPSGIDMTRDIGDRLRLFGASVEVQRLALNMDQVEEYDPPPNPAKTTDARFAGYAAQYGDESWELDALEPTVLDALVTNAIAEYTDPERHAQMELREARERDELSVVAKQWDNAVAHAQDCEDTDGGN